MKQTDKEKINTFEYQAPNGENWNDVRNRGISFFRDHFGKEAKVSQDLAKKPMILFTHGGFICSLSYHLGQKDIITNSSCMAISLDESDLTPKTILYEWEFPLDAVI